MTTANFVKRNTVQFVLGGSLLLFNACSSKPNEVAKKSKLKKIENTESRSVANSKVKNPNIASGNIAAQTPVPPQEHMIQFIPPVYEDNIELTDNQINYDENVNEGYNDNRYVQETIKSDLWVPNQGETPIYEVIEEPAEYPGGTVEMNAFIIKNLVFPEVAKEMGIQDKCYLRFVIDVDGSISSIKVMRGVTDCPECDKEAIRVLKMMPKWIPGKNNGEAVKTYFTLPIKFYIKN